MSFLSLIRDSGAVDIRDHMPLLYCLATQSKGPIIELGTRNGYSTLALLLGAKRADHWIGVVSVDIDPECEGMVVETARKHKLEYLLESRRWFWNGDSVKAAEWWRKTVTEKVGLLFLDSDHSYGRVRDELEAWQPLMADDGVICGHDYALEGAGVQQAVNEFVNEHNYHLLTWYNCFGFFVLTK